MRRTVPLLAIVAALIVGPAGAQQPASRRPASSCVACHATLARATEAGHGFLAWRQSRHAAAGVGCEACHGGDPAATDREAAHRGVAPSSDTASLVYFTRVPDTCGRCHAVEAGYFRSSAHYARLRGDGRGPNCVTCHGAMATAVPTPGPMLGTCAACHNGGVAPAAEAREAARTLAQLQAESELLDVLHGAAARSAAGAALARRRLDEAGRRLAAAAEVWHTFRLDSTAADLDAADSSLAAAWTALGHRAPLRSPPPARP